MTVWELFTAEATVLPTDAWQLLVPKRGTRVGAGIRAHAGTPTETRAIAAARAGATMTAQSLYGLARAEERLSSLIRTEELRASSQIPQVFTVSLTVVTRTSQARIR